MKMNIFIVLVGFLAGCTITVVPQELPQHMLEFPERTLAEWQPDRAVEEAMKDIRSGKIKIYISGTTVPYSPGVKPEQYPLIANLPNADAGIGCLIEDSELRKAQFEYAKEYNEYVVNHLLQK
jgi:hypothetical protein